MPSYSNNYSKWDALEISDDSDIEGHPNVDHKSLVIWKQRDIHEKREARKQRMAENEATIQINEVLLPKLQKIQTDLQAGGSKYFSQLVQRLREQPSPDKPPHPEAVTYDSMIEALLNRVFGEVVHEQGVSKDDEEKLSAALNKQLKIHIDKFIQLTNDAKKQLEEDVSEQSKHITSDDLHVGFDSKYAPPPKPKEPEPAIKPKGTQKATTIETLNSPKPTSTSTPAPTPSAPKKTPDPDELFDSDDEDDDDDPVPSMTESLKAFAKIPIGDFERSYEFLQRDKGPFVEGGVDALLVEAFQAEMAGKSRYAKQCVYQGLMVQYCEKLGPDGVGMFFKKMIAGNKQSLSVFETDVDQTYTIVKKRVVANKVEQAKIAEQGGVEQIQLVAEDPSTVISFDVPDGPPPADLRLEGPGTEGLDIEQVRRVLQLRWDIFQSFDAKFQKALQSNNLENVNKVLGKMGVEEAEKVVEQLQESNILQFAEEGIRDETGRNKA